VTDLRRRLREAEEVAYAEFLAQIDGLSHAEWEEPFLGSQGWSAKDIVFHVAAWLTSCGHELERIRAGTYVDGEVEDEEVERRNLEWFEVSTALDVETVRAELAAARARMLQEFEASEPVPAAVEWFTESGDLHYRDHAEQLRRWRTGPERSRPGRLG
jgi:hypothetical protein